MVEVQRIRPGRSSFVISQHPIELLMGILLCLGFRLTYLKIVIGMVRAELINDKTGQIVKLTEV